MLMAHKIALNPNNAQATYFGRAALNSIRPKDAASSLFPRKRTTAEIPDSYRAEGTPAARDLLDLFSGMPEQNLVPEFSPFHHLLQDLEDIDMFLDHGLHEGGHMTVMFAFVFSDHGFHLAVHLPHVF